MSGRHRKDDPTLQGVLLVDKPAGPTSHDVVGWVRWVLGVKRVGHAGTLDPAATGLLVVAVGEATKLTPYLTGQDKGYRARFVLGASTTTGDAEGEVLEACPCPAELEARVPAALAALTEIQALPPPAYSAIHVDGQRAHELARAGQAPVLEARPMTVHALVPGPVTRRGDRVEVEVDLVVSKGTYVRSLAEALGRSLGVPAHLGGLHRTRSGALDLSDPRAVTGLVAERVAVPPRPGRAQSPPPAPRWRLRLPACEAARESLRAPEASERDTPPPAASATAEHLRARLLAPSEAIPLPVVRLPDDDSGRRAMLALASGRALPWPCAGVEAPAAGRALPEDAARVAVTPGVGAGLVVARIERPGHGDGEPAEAVLRPERVVIGPPAHS